MPHRHFKDEKQITWEVWDVHPGEVDRRLRSDREVSSGTLSVVRAAGPGRELARGWLCFESHEAKRRLWPIPSGWDRLDDAQLAELCSRAKDAPAR
jgi:hypothetical protein